MAHLHSDGIAAGASGLAASIVLEVIGVLGIAGLVVRHRRRASRRVVSG